MLFRDGVAILLKEPLNLVRHIQSVVRDGERGVRELGHLVDSLVCRFVELRVKLLQERRVAAEWQPGFLIQDRQNPELAFHEINRRLVVVEVYESPIDLLLDIVLLRQLKDVGIKFVL